MVIMQGPLLKWTNMMKGYQQRWFVLDEINGLLSYYTSPEKLVRGDRRGCIRLRDAILGIEDDDDTIFSITSDTEVFHCKDVFVIIIIIICIKQNQKHQRSNALLMPIQQQQQRSIDDIDDDEDDEKILNKFNHYLIETDSYLQILIKQFQKLDSKITTTANGDDIIGDDKSTDQIKLLKERSTYFLDSIKHTIVLLQIAKNLKFPVSGIYRQQPQQQQQSEHQESSEDLSLLNKVPENNLPDNQNATIINDFSIVNDNDEKQSISSIIQPDLNNVDDESTLIRNQQLQQSSSSEFQPNKSTLDDFIYSDKFIKNYYNQTIPDISYASSGDDDDDDFFDANDESENSDNSMSLIKMPSTKKLSLRATSMTTSSTCDNNNDDDDDGQNVVVASVVDDNDEINFDKLYESSDDSNDELQCHRIQSHGSVISHLISQVKIGMDLTKVALPTFILERRSLLEMYADFFAHADIFCSIPDYKTPEERMIQVTRWYLSAFHAGRKGSIAKKPYNPILGEVFRCYWNLSSTTTTTNNNDSPLPWAKTSDLIFIAEQVSHHPPISAFYAENIEKRIMCCAQIWTKSKFLGLSIGVNNIGKGSIYLLDHDEEYTCTFPSAYGRSILTEPWFEFGGSVQIECEKSGYQTKIDFLTKPFYGGKRNRINAEIFDPNKKLLATINGEWNGRMEVKFIRNKSLQPKSEPFVDTKTLPVIKKQVKPINEQEDYESRKLWKHVTLALKKQNVDEATEAKYQIEQRQRELVKEREQLASKWQNRMFHNIGEKWIFNEPLTNRKSLTR
ncbi:Oxysterol-binding protein- protein 9 [Dermatophagoides pteronyssinus]|uniref:Oxysterol-binding protein n=1 Tax=Dermatophagoides pteronyssinus TaxID=6956 RepID=A0ABQ8IST6_DERPT|nr:Oxysterol-binding protein- protein 9 [Dermatophagoides pteronyssinus]